MGAQALTVGTQDIHRHTIAADTLGDTAIQVFISDGVVATDLVLATDPALATQVAIMAGMAHH